MTQSPSAGRMDRCCFVRRIRWDGSVAGAPKDQQLMLEQQRLCHDCASTTGPHELGQRDQQVSDKYEQLPHELELYWPWAQLQDCTSRLHFGRIVSRKGQ